VIVCSCTMISDSDIEDALVEILNQPNAPIPTPGVVYRQLSRRMNCCSCAPLAVETIYKKVNELEKKGLICPDVGATARSKLIEFTGRRAPRAGTDDKPVPQPNAQDGQLKVA